MNTTPPDISYTLHSQRHQNPRHSNVGHHASVPERVRAQLPPSPHDTRTPPYIPVSHSY
ncbi:hypothetical protein EX30DRAFT_340420 [Ascodesmis nigricans]|uniref:Uncharacterized protein n=1 Tax=Ascodesmis nigricans TaxID=341454 RepID=A0A4S2MXV7_9PEZI|nr:hypothetical protein EX30DRAFT_340420 [Ascodesmis nigricans]